MCNLPAVVAAVPPPDDPAGRMASKEQRGWEACQHLQPAHPLVAVGMLHHHRSVPVWVRLFPAHHGHCQVLCGPPQTTLRQHLQAGLVKGTHPSSHVIVNQLVTVYMINEVPPSVGVLSTQSSEKTAVKVSVMSRGGVCIRHLRHCKLGM